MNNLWPTFDKFIRVDISINSSNELKRTFKQLEHKLSYCCPSFGRFD